MIIRWSTKFKVFGADIYC